MIRAFFIAGAAAALACNSVQTVFAGGQFAAPTGLAVTSAADRDVLFIANAGQDNLRALQLCNHALFADGGVEPGDTCPRNEDQQFLPGPIRVFPANIETGNRPLHLAGARLLQADGSPTGAVLAAGADTDVRVLDARALVDAAHGKGTKVTVMSVPLGTPVSDVIAVNALDGGVETGAPAVTALAITAGPPALLVQMNLTVDPDGGVAQPAVVGQCTLDPVVPRRLAVAAGGDVAYVADGVGDGVVRVPIAAIAAGGACPAERIPTGLGKRPTRAVAVSPTWYDDAGTVHPPGELVMMILEPSTDADAGTDLDPGGVLLARAADKRIVPIPPNDINDPTATLQPMQPITPPGLPREGAFLPALDLTNCTPGDGGVAIFPCTPLYTGSPASQPFENFSLLAAVSSTTGNTYFIDVVNRRFISSTYYDLSPPGSLLNLVPGVGTPTLSASLGTTPLPQFNLAPPDAPNGGTHPASGWVTPGVTRATTWQVSWHADIPGLQTRGGTLTPTATGTMLFKGPGIDFSQWVNDPVLKLRVGDVVTFSRYIPPASTNTPQACIDLATTENQSPVRFETPILSIVLPDTLELANVPGTDTTRPFDVTACPGGLGAVATVRTAADQPWLVLDQLTPKGRIKTGDFFVGTDRRFDYPLDYTRSGAVAPLATDNSAIAFTLTGSEPGVPGARWTISTSTGLFPVFFGDTSVNPATGLASDVITYRSPRRTMQVFTAVTGQNSVVQADPLLPLTNSATITSGVITYK